MVHYLPTSVVSNAELFVDDIQIDVEADTEQEAATTFVDMAEVFGDTIRADMRADLAYEKAKVVGAAPGRKRNDRMAKAACARLGKTVGAEVIAVHNIGIDFAAGLERASCFGRPGTLRKVRVAKGRRRAARGALLRDRLRSGSKHKAKRWYAGDVRAIAYYGAEVRRLDNKELAHAWRLAVKCLSPSTSDRSIEALAFASLGSVVKLPYA